MNFKSLIACFFLCFMATSCIQDEAPNAEADIEACTVPGDVLNRTPIIENDKITLQVKQGADITKMAPEFILTAGATINPASGTVLNFMTRQFYTVTSEDKQWTKKYEVNVAFSQIATSCHFDNARLKDGKYQVLYETNQLGEELMTWASGNEGFAFTGVQAPPQDYPTSLAPNGVKGSCLKLETKTTGSLGSMLKMPIAAGNLFMGSFSVNIGDILSSTKFGMPFVHIPDSFAGYYKYKAGNGFTVNGKPVAGRKDICDIYAVFYETDSQVNSLDGNTVLTSPNLVSIARIQNVVETNEWTKFDLKFVLKENKTVDPIKLQLGRYNIALVFSSSIRGAYFEGAIGSTLYIDEVELSYTDPE